MTTLVTVNTLTSLEVAEMVGREHKNVMQDIRKIIKDLGELKVQPSSYFIESTYKNKQNKTQPMYLVTKQGCELYGNRMTGIDGTAFSVKYVERFNEMEEAERQPQFKLPQTYSEALRALADQVDETKKVEAKLAISEPKAEALDSLTGNTSKLMTIGQIATNYGMSAMKFNALLHELGVQYKKSGVWKLYAKYEGNGYTATPTGESEQGYVYKNMKWTTKGEYFLYELLKKHGYESTAYDLIFGESK